MPHLAIKMAYLVIYPLAVCAAITISMLWSWTAGRIVGGRIETAAASATVAALCLLIARAAFPVTQQKPTVSEPLYLAGRWARDHVPDPACVDYIVTDNHTAYWLHPRRPRQPADVEREPPTTGHSIHASKSSGGSIREGCLTRWLISPRFPGTCSGGERGARTIWLSGGDQEARANLAVRTVAQSC